MKNTNWFEDGKDAAIDFLELLELHNQKDQPIPECPWPIYAPEGIKWIQGWNSVAREDKDLRERPGVHGNLFMAEADR